MKFIRLRKLHEGYFAPVGKSQKIETTLDRAKTIVGADAVRYYLYSLLFYKLAKPNNYCDRKIDLIDSFTERPLLDFGYRIPNLYKHLASAEGGDSSPEAIKRWNKRYNDFYNNGLEWEDIFCGNSVPPIKEVKYSGGKFTAVVRLIPTGTAMALSPDGVMDVFQDIEKELAEKVHAPVEINFVILTGSARNSREWTTVIDDTETLFPGETITNISLYCLDSAALKTKVLQFIEKFNRPKRGIVNQLNIINCDIKSLDDIPDFGVRFNSIKFSNIRDYTDHAVGNNKFKFNMAELGDYRRLLSDDTPTEQHHYASLPAIVIFPYCMRPKDVERISGGIISTEACYYYFGEMVSPCAFNPKYHADLSPNRDKFEARTQMEDDASA